MGIYVRRIIALILMVCVAADSIAAAVTRRTCLPAGRVVGRESMDSPLTTGGNDDRGEFQWQALPSHFSRRRASPAEMLAGQALALSATSQITGIPHPALSTSLHHEEADTIPEHGPMRLMTYELLERESHRHFSKGLFYSFTLISSLAKILDVPADSLVIMTEEGGSRNTLVVQHLGKTLAGLEYSFLPAYTPHQDILPGTVVLHKAFMPTDEPLAPLLTRLLISYVLHDRQAQAVLIEPSPPQEWDPWTLVLQGEHPLVYSFSHQTAGNGTSSKWARVDLVEAMGHLNGRWLPDSADAPLAQLARDLAWPARNQSLERMDALLEDVLKPVAGSPLSVAGVRDVFYASQETLFDQMDVLHLWESLTALLESNRDKALIKYMVFNMSPTRDSGMCFILSKGLLEACHRLGIPAELKTIDPVEENMHGYVVLGHAIAVDLATAQIQMLPAKGIVVESAAAYGTKIQASCDLWRELLAHTFRDRVNELAAAFAVQRRAVADAIEAISRNQGWTTPAEREASLQLLLNAA